MLSSQQCYCFRSCSLLTVTQRYSSRCTAQALEGAAWAGEGAAATALIGDFTAYNTRGIGLGLYGTTGYLGWMVGPISGGALAEAAGFRLTFLICSLLNAADPVLTAVFLRQNSGEVSGSSSEPDKR